MGFRFSLATVLRVRGIAEEREEQMLQRITQEMAQTQAAARVVEASIAERNAMPEVLGRGMDVHAAYAERSHWYSRREELAQQLVKLEELRGLQMQAYATARREREMLSEMCDAKRGVYDAEAARRVQRAVDDNVMARRARSRDLLAAIKAS